MPIILAGKLQESAGLAATANRAQLVELSESPNYQKQGHNLPIVKREDAK